MRMLIAPALLFFTLSADAQVVRPDSWDDRRDSRDPYYRDPYYRNDPYYEDDRDYRRERRRERRRDRRDDDYSGYGRQSGYGYGRDPVDLAQRVMSDVRMVAGNNSGIEKHDRKHFEEVEEELGKFTRKYREGKYDRNNLKDAAESLQHLAGSRGIRSQRDRRILQDALYAVEQLRSGSYGVDTRSRTGDDPIWGVFGGR